MPRPTEQKAAIEAERLALLHSEQRKLRARLTKEVKIKKASPHLPGEERQKKQMAVLLKVGVPGISYTEIGARLGETKSVVKGWFQKDADLKEFYMWVLENLKDGALELMKTYSLEAVETLAVLMRFGSEKYMFESAREILDRIGVPKVSRSEIEAEHVQRHEWSDRDSLTAEIRELPPEYQEEAIKVVERLENLLAEHSSVEDNSDDEEELKPIAGSDDDILDEEED